MSKEFVKMQMGFESIRESVVKLHDALNKKFPNQNVIEIKNAHELVKMASGHFMLDGKTPLEDLGDEEIKIISDFLQLSEDAVIFAGRFIETFEKTIKYLFKKPDDFRQISGRAKRSKQAIYEIIKAI